jgi:hypothetical protein
LISEGSSDFVEEPGWESYSDVTQSNASHDDGGNTYQTNIFTAANI